jgi:DUF1680 family protein
LNRRELLGSAAAAVVAAAISRTSIPALAAVSAAPSTSPSSPSSRLKLRTFEYADVALTAGPLKQQYDHALDIFLNLDEDRALKVYRQCAGLPSPGLDMGGWYDPGAFAPGHALGQWISALSRFAGAGSAQAGEKVHRLVDGFAATLGAGRAFYDGHRFPSYVYDKHVIGLTDAFRYAGVERAADILRKTTDIALPFLPEKALTRAEQRERPHKDISYTWDESYTIAENLFIAHDVFGDERYLQMARRYLHDLPYFDRLARGEPAMVGEHAYSHVNALGSAAMAYIVLGKPKHLAAIKNAWDMIVRDQQYASGGWGPNEEFVKPGEGKLFESLHTTHKHFETPCGTYATFKHARYLQQITGDGSYGDGLERILYNGILAAKAISADGSTFYYSDYAQGAHKTYHPDKWPCCSGTYPQAVVDYLVNAYFHDDRDLYVNLYVPSTLHWKRDASADVRISQETNYPDAEQIVLRIDPSAASEFAVHLRIPGFCASRPKLGISVNGRPVEILLRDGFAAVMRRWQAGDTLELSLPLHDRIEPIDAQHPNTVALMRGPLMLVGVPRRPLLDTTSRPVRADFRFVPFYKINDEPYTTYFTQD